jgi:hypothetical protein
MGSFPYTGQTVQLYTRRSEMPSVSAKQAKTMAAAAHNPQFAKKVGIPESVAREFNKADKRTGILRKKKQQGRTGDND